MESCKYEVIDLTSLSDDENADPTPSSEPQQPRLKPFTPASSIIAQQLHKRHQDADGRGDGDGDGLMDGDGIGNGDGSKTNAALGDGDGDGDDDGDGNEISWPCLLGSFDAQAISLCRGVDTIQYGDILIFSAIQNPAKNIKKSKSKPNVGNKRKRQDHSVRFCVRRRKEMEMKCDVTGAVLPSPSPSQPRLEQAKLDAAEAFALRPLLQRNMIALAGEVRYAPQQINYSSTILVALHGMLSVSASV